MHSSVGVFTFSVFAWEYFLRKYGPKKLSCQFKLKSGTYTNSNIEIESSIMMFTFSFLDHKYLFKANLVKKIEIIKLGYNLLPKPIRICKTQWSYLLSPFFTGYTLFG